MAPHIKKPIPSPLASRLLRTSLMAVWGFAFLATGCMPTGSENSEPALEAEDVSSGIEISTENDIQEAPRKEGLAGVLPAAFPDDLPIYLPSSLVNMGDAPDGLWVELLSPRKPAQITSDLRQKLSQRGWQVSEESSGIFRLQKDGRQSRLTIRLDGGGTLYRYSY